MLIISPNKGRPLWIRLANKLIGLFNRTGLQKLTFESEAMIDKVCSLNGLDDFGGDSFREPLDVLVRSFRAEAHADLFGQWLFGGMCMELLRNRLRIQNDLTRHPEITRVPITRPLYVTGLPRTGTTLLHRLLSLAPGARPLLYWESIEPSPPPFPMKRETDPRISRAKDRVRGLSWISPEVLRYHEIEPNGPEECHPLLMNTFQCPFFPFLFHIPTYIDYLAGCNLTEAYRYYRTELQLLSWKIQAKPWVLKAPAHLMALRELLAAIPDANIVIMHRDPAEVLASLCNFTAAVRRIYSPEVDQLNLGNQILDGISRILDRASDTRRELNPDRFLDVSYTDLVSDPIGTVRRIHERFAYPWDYVFEARLRNSISDHLKHKDGVHRYELDAFGLSAGEVRYRFTDEVVAARGA